MKFLSHNYDFESFKESKFDAKYVNTVKLTTCHLDIPVCDTPTNR